VTTFTVSKDKTLFMHRLWRKQLF